MNIKLEDFDKVKEFYQRANEYLNQGKLHLAVRELHNRMPYNLYDLSLDILFNTNDDFSDEELRNLVTKVDTELSKQSNVDSEPDIYDHFSDNVF